MASAFGLQVKKLIKHIVMYVLGLIVVLAIIIGVGFTVAKPKVMNLAKAEMRKHGVEAQNVDISVFGTLTMRDVTLPVKEGSLHIDKVAARPPLHFWGRTWLGGKGSLYGLQINKDNINVSIPELSFSGVALEDKNPKIASKSLQMLDRLQVGSLSAKTIQVSLSPQGSVNNPKLSSLEKTAGKATITDFYLDDLSYGQINQISYQSVDSNIDFPAFLISKEQVASNQDIKSHQEGEKEAGSSSQKAHIEAATGAFNAYDLDVAALYVLAKEIAPSSSLKNNPLEFQMPRRSENLVGVVDLQNVKLGLNDEQLGTIKANIKQLGSQGLSLKGDKSIADFISHEGFTVRKQDGETDNKQVIIHNIRQLVANLSALNIKMQGMELDVHLRERNVHPDMSDAELQQIEADAEETKRRLADEPEKTVNDILNEEREDKLAQVEAKRLHKRVKHLPHQFKLSVDSFDIKADNWKQVIPYNFHIGVKDLVYTPGVTDNPVILSLQQIAGQSLQISFLADARWNPSDSVFNINALTVYDPNLGGFSVQSKIRDVPQSFFAGKTKFLDVILKDAAIANMDIVFQDKGFMNKIMQWVTTLVDVPMQELQEDLHDVAVKSPPLLLKDHEEAQNFSNKLGAFVAESGNLRISMSAPHSGLRMSDIMSSSYNLSDLLDKLKLTVERPSYVSFAN